VAYPASELIISAILIFSHSVPLTPLILPMKSKSERFFRHPQFRPVSLLIILFVDNFIYELIFAVHMPFRDYFTSEAHYQIAKAMIASSAELFPNTYQQQMSQFELQPDFDSFGFFEEMYRWAESVLPYYHIITETGMVPMKQMVALGVNPRLFELDHDELVEYSGKALGYFEQIKAYVTDILRFYNSVAQNTIEMYELDPKNLDLEMLAETLSNKRELRSNLRLEYNNPAEIMGQIQEFTGYCAEFMNVCYDILDELPDFLKEEVEPYVPSREQLIKTMDVSCVQLENYLKQIFSS
jgi:hypothetical protein